MVSFLSGPAIRHIGLCRLGSVAPRCSGASLSIVPLLKKFPINRAWKPRTLPMVPGSVHACQETSPMPDDPDRPRQISPAPKTPSDDLRPEAEIYGLPEEEWYDLVEHPQPAQTSPPPLDQPVPNSSGNPSPPAPISTPSDKPAPPPSSAKWPRHLKILRSWRRRYAIRIWNACSGFLRRGTRRQI